MTIKEVREITSKLKTKENLVKKKEGSTVASYYYENDEYKYSSYDSPTTSMENLTRKSDNVTIFSHLNGRNSFSN